ncbi:hypothetical protein ASG50_18690 [Rhizobium sp. Leaf386]|nr:hypothetical protein ASG50_18690 [Rhizobium sp. Leaf386]
MGRPSGRNTGKTKAVALSRRRLFGILGATAFGIVCGGLAPAQSHAQDYPAKPIKIVVGFNPGGITDSVARITADFLQRRIGQTVVVENRPGAGSSIAAGYVASSEPDGYTLLLATADLGVLPATRSNLPYDVARDFTFVALPFIQNPLIAVSADSPYAKTEDLILAMGANPNKIRFGHPGVGSINHLGTVMMESAINVKGVPISYTGAGPIFIDLAGGNIDFFTGASYPPPAGVKIIGPAGSKRHPSYPDLPTLAELGYPAAAYDPWFGVVAPAGVPADVLGKLNTELKAVYTDPEAITKFQAALAFTPEKDYLTDQAFRDYVLKQSQEWAQIAKRENIVVQQ